MGKPHREQGKGEAGHISLLLLFHHRLKVSEVSAIGLGFWERMGSGGRQWLFGIRTYPCVPFRVPM